MLALSKCPICGGRLALEMTTRSSKRYHITNGGRLSARYKDVTENGGRSDGALIMCENAECDFLVNDEMECEKYPYIKVLTMNGAFFYDTGKEN